MYLNEHIYHLNVKKIHKLHREKMHLNMRYIFKIAQITKCVKKAVLKFSVITDKRVMVKLIKNYIKVNQK